MDFFATVSLGSLRPTDDKGRQWLAKKHGKTVKVTVSEPRNIKQLRMYWALIHTIFPSQSTWLTEEDLSDAIKCAVGHCEVTPLKDGRMMVRPKSISFSKADQEQWEAFFNAVINLVITKILPGVKEDDLRKELEEITGVAA